MTEEQKNIYLERKDYSKIQTVFPLPVLLAVQKESYAKFLQMELLPDERNAIGLQSAFKEIFPVSDFKETTELDFISYSIGNWECTCGRLKGVENSRPRCNGCGTCVEVCPVENISLETGTPEWLNNCVQCMACIQWCPEEAIQYGDKTSDRLRYHNPEISMEDIKI